MVIQSEAHVRWFLPDAEYAIAVQSWKPDFAARGAFHVREVPYGLRIAQLRHLLEAHSSISAAGLAFLGGKELGEGPYGVTVVTFAVHSGAYLNVTVQKLVEPIRIGAIASGPNVDIEENEDGCQVVVASSTDHSAASCARPDGQAVFSSAYGKRRTSRPGSEPILVPPPATAAQLRELVRYLADQDLQELTKAPDVLPPNDFGELPW